MLCRCWVCDDFCDPDDPNDNSMRIEENRRCFCSKHLEEGFAQVFESLGFEVRFNPEGSVH